MPGARLLGLVAVTAFPALASIASSSADCAGAKAGSSVRIFADARFYLERTEAEESFRGVLRRARVREGPDTRDMPFELVAGDERLAVYVSRVEEEMLRPFVDHEVEVIGKRIDLRDEGFDVDIWIATIAIPETRVEPDG